MSAAIANPTVKKFPGLPWAQPQFPGSDVRTEYYLKRTTLSAAAPLILATNNFQGGNSHVMSLTSEFQFANDILLLLKNDLQEQSSELTRAIDRTHKEIRALADSGPGDVIDESCDNCSKEAIFATYSQNRTQLRKVEAALERIATGNFGICAACGGAIGLKRLQALTWANNCVECQEQSEQLRIH